MIGYEMLRSKDSLKIQKGLRKRSIVNSGFDGKFYDRLFIQA